MSDPHTESSLQVVEPPTITEFDAVVSNFHDGPCEYCASDKGCPCHTWEELYGPGSNRVDGFPDGTKDPKCRCSCGQCYAPWGEVLDDE